MTLTTADRRTPAPGPAPAPDTPAARDRRPHRAVAAVLLAGVLAAACGPSRTTLQATAATDTTTTPSTTTAPDGPATTTTTVATTTSTTPQTTTTTTNPPSVTISDLRTTDPDVSTFTWDIQAHLSGTNPWEVRFTGTVRSPDTGPPWYSWVDYGDGTESRAGVHADPPEGFRCERAPGNWALEEAVFALRSYGDTLHTYPGPGTYQVTMGFTLNSCYYDGGSGSYDAIATFTLTLS